MKSVAVVCSCLSLCLWANVGTASPVSSDLPRLDRLFYTLYVDAPEAEELMNRARPCLEKAMAAMDPADLESVTRYVDFYRQCESQVSRKATQIEREAKLESCLEGAPPNPEVHGEALQGAFEVCATEALSTNGKDSTGFSYIPY